MCRGVGKAGGCIARCGTAPEQGLLYGYSDSIEFRMELHLCS